MSNPFEDPATTYMALVNRAGQYSLWPEHIAVPDGWTVAYGPDGRHDCLAWIDREWTDMRPREND
ncbi:MAG: MbtH family protein [Acidimicrobiales bacterium]